MKYSIPDKRELTKPEKELLEYLFAKEKANWNNLIADLKVIARCGCGKCPTIMFGKTLESKTEKGKLIIDYFGKGKNGDLIGVSLFGNEKMPTELEFYTVNGESEVTELPILDSLKPVSE
ncbi:hypothetical protein [Maribacter sp. IgM3_T14_3]|uniref:hypothetical protein n=1 Tax=Maribacter sp. IgM3_T14_3 TaxID=3415140 RepID=UPI003C6F4FDC